MVAKYLELIQRTPTAIQKGINMYAGRFIVIAWRSDEAKDLYRFKTWYEAVEFMKANRRSKRDDKAIQFQMFFDEDTADEFIGTDPFISQVIG